MCQLKYYMQVYIHINSSLKKRGGGELEICNRHLFLRDTNLKALDISKDIS